MSAPLSMMAATVVEQAMPPGRKVGEIVATDWRVTRSEPAQRGDLPTQGQLLNIKRRHRGDGFGNEPQLDGRENFLR
ncbi:MAG: hypothetical protein ACI8TP_002633 [Acidimicrobiales bacterium]|jgi:hypothetical protein